MLGCVGDAVLKRLLLAGGVTLALGCTASAADMAVAPGPGGYAPVAAPAPYPYYDWTGVYLGPNLGAAWASLNNAATTDAITGAAVGSTTPSGVWNWGIAGGGQIGANWLPACVAMFTEEVGVSPAGGDGGAMYRARVTELIVSGRAFARIENGRVVFKAEIGAVAPLACQVQGVWVNPHLRGKGLAAPGMAAVVTAAQRMFAPLVTLYVNDFNSPARAAYHRTGFTEVGTFTSVLF